MVFRRRVGALEQFRDRQHPRAMVGLAFPRWRNRQRLAAILLRQANRPAVAPDAVEARDGKRPATIQPFEVVTELDRTAGLLQQMHDHRSFWCTRSGGCRRVLAMVRSGPADWGRDYRPRSEL